MQYFAYSQKAFLYKYVVMQSDVDQFKHMSFANYLKLMFLASDALLVSFFEASSMDILRLKLVESRMQFKKQTVYGDNILIKINSSEILNDKFSLLHTFLMEGTGELVGLGRQTYSLFDSSGVKKEEMPSGIKSVIGPICVDEKYLLYKF